MDILHHFKFISETENLGNAIQAEYHYGLVFLSIVIAIVSSYMAFLVSSRIRTSEYEKRTTLWMLIGSFALGCGIWAMHFIGMLAYILPMNARYDVTTTIISVIPVLLSSYIILNTSYEKNNTFQSILFRSVVVGVGIGLMHFIGMSAMNTNGIMRYDLALFIVSFLLAIFLSSISLKYKLQADKRNSGNTIFSFELLLPSVIMGTAISAMHYTGMAAMEVYPASLNNHITSSWSSDDLTKLISIFIFFLMILLVIAIEISNRFDLYQKIKHSEQNLAITLNSIADAVIATDTNSLITQMNPVAEKLTGWTFEDAKNKELSNVLSLIDSENGNPIYIPFEEVVSSGKTVFLNNNIKLISKDGNEHLVTDSAAPILNIENKIQGIVFVFNDITQHYKLRSDREKLQSQLHHSQKMDALGKLTGGIAHDYNNMLGVILGYAELLELSLTDQPELMKYTQEIIHASEHSSSLTKKLLSFSKNKKPESSCINLNSFLNNEKNMLEKTLTARIKLIFEFEDDLWDTFLDENDLQDTILNLSINAMHAIDGNGKLTIRTSNKQINKTDAEIFSISQGDYVCLSITDTGSGIEKEIKEKIFEPFFSTKGGSGSGLGLSQVYGFIGRSNAAVKVYSEVDHGTNFQFYFPRHINKSSTETRVQTESTKYKFKGNKKVLIVDDEPALLKLSTDILQRNNFEVIPAESAKLALDVLKDKNVDVLLSDIIMPEMDGFQLAAIVKEKYPNVRIQLMSGFTDERNLEMVDKKLQSNILGKPFKSNDLLEKIYDLINDE